VRYGLPATEGAFGDWGPTEEVEDEEGGWGAVDGTGSQQSIFERVQSMVGHLVGMLPLAAAVGAGRTDAASSEPADNALRATAREALRVMALSAWLSCAMFWECFI
jgi:hypothetical protein